jgi:hypothetical protein
MTRRHFDGLISPSLPWNYLVTSGNATLSWNPTSKPHMDYGCERSSPKSGHSCDERDIGAWSHTGWKVCRKSIVLALRGVKLSYSDQTVNPCQPDGQTLQLEVILQLVHTSICLPFHWRKRNGLKYGLTQQQTQSRFCHDCISRRTDAGIGPPRSVHCAFHDPISFVRNPVTPKVAFFHICPVCDFNHFFVTWVSLGDEYKDGCLMGCFAV